MHRDYTLGTTSAYAENTRYFRIKAERERNYLRVRGEYISRPVLPRGTAELPPRTRRILSGFFVALVDIGTTSAYAENTQTGGFRYGPTRNYLRVRGEYPK